MIENRKSQLAVSEESSTPKRRKNQHLAGVLNRSGSMRAKEARLGSTLYAGHPESPTGLAVVAEQSCPNRPAPKFSLDELIALHAIAVASPHLPVLAPPTAHQVRAHMHVGTAAVARNEVVSADVEKPYLVAMTTSDIGETLAQQEVAGTFAFWHCSHLRTPL
jgi:hypothetical protein